MTRMAARFASVVLGTSLFLLGWSFRPSLAQAPAGGTVALTGARVMNGASATPLEQATILIANGRIEAVGAAVTVPAGATRVDMSGKTIVPGSSTPTAPGMPIQSHGRSPRSWPGQLRVYADYGITTGGRLGTGAKDLERRGQAARCQEREHSIAPASMSPDRASGISRRQRGPGGGGSLRGREGDLIKIHITGGPNDMTPRSTGLIDQAHGGALGRGAHLLRRRMRRGCGREVDVIAHSVRDQDVDQALIAQIKQRNVGYIPTFTRDLAQFVYEATPAFFTDPFFVRHINEYRRDMTTLSDPALQEKTRNNKDAQSVKVALQQGSRNLKTLSDAGVLIAMGPDTGTNLGQWQGYFEHVELEYMVNAGLTPMQTLVAATGGAARAMKLDQHMGTIQPGKRADLLVLNANPLTDIKNTRRIHSVWVGGRR